MNIYDYQRPVGKIDDIPELRNQIIALYDARSHRDMVRFCLLLGQHVLEITGFDPCPEITGSFGAMQRWIDGKTNYHQARNLGFELGKFARVEKDAIKARFYRTMAQLAGSPHVKYHALWATDFAITLINRMYPGNLEEVKKEREWQIESITRIDLPGQPAINPW